MIRRMDPSRAQAALIVKTVAKFTPLIRDRLAQVGLGADTPLVIAEVQYRAWCAAIDVTVPEVERYVQGTIALWIRDHVRRTVRESIAPSTAAAVVCADPADQVESSWEAERLSTYMIRYIGGETVHRIFRGTYRPSATGSVARTTRVICAALDLADTTHTVSRDALVACLEESDSHALYESASALASQRAVSMRHAHSLKNVARDLYFVAAGVYRTEKSSAATNFPSDWDTP
ncbi:hypothetical protein [Lysinibacter sp. HNR]|uniref:hypothetical protein n=1 Tax=Lysinibacter sp. HNR TaxID=3031408 RepID=UPI0024353AA2|nr:hypothetical protein [Lysinibacter sp. HNR]WGD37559.1 hypothetical protein FrondiHNR_01145 [Lysinibacter sp. HNR]